MLKSQGRLVRQRSIIIAAVVLGVAAVAIAYFGLADRRFGENDADPATYAPGYVGTSAFGDWVLICTPAAETATPPVSFDIPDAGAKANAIESTCRIRYEAYAANDQQSAAADQDPRVILDISLSRVGPNRSPALMLRLPPTLAEGDPVTIRTRGDFSFEVLARDCSAEECVAAGSLSEEEWDRLVEASGIQVVFPLDETQRVAVDVSDNGLRDALTVLEAAQAPAP